MTTRRQLITTVIAAITVISVFIGGMYLYATRDRDTQLTLTTSPLAASVTINGRDYGMVPTNTTLDVTHTGTIDVQVTRGGFSDYTTSLTDTEREMSLRIDLEPYSDAAFEVLDQDAQALEEAEITEEQLDSADRAYEEWPILKELPRETDTFRAYQGLSDDSAHDFAIHLYLYADGEDAGRDAFTAWMREKGYAIEDYEVIEHVDEAQPPAFTLPDKPTRDDLQDLTPADINVSDAPKRPELAAADLAVAFATYTSTWDSATDHGRADAIERARPLMSKKRADSVKVPEKPLLPPRWKSAARDEAQSYAWPIALHVDSETSTSTTYSVSTCWAWISDHEAPAVDGSRDYTITVTEQKNGYAVTAYEYDDPDPFVDYTTEHCLTR